MKPLALAAALMAVAACNLVGQSAGEPNEGSHVVYDPGTDTYTFSWWGRTDNTYFVHVSEDLATWTYLPIIEPGRDQAIGWSFMTTASRMFFRLKYSDTKVGNPWTADFDGDGVANVDELQQGTDPFTNADTNSNGLPDDWETFHGVTSPTEDNEPDGQTALSEFTNGRNPNVKDHPAVQLVVF